MSPEITIQTTRLDLVPFCRNHFDSFYESCICNAEVMRFYHAYRQPESDSDRRARAERDFVDHFSAGETEFGYVCWALLTRPANSAKPDFVGWCGVLSPALDHSSFGPEIAYMLARAWHGMGLATEATQAVLDDAWVRYKIGRLHAVVDTPNLPSRRVLERVGLHEKGPVEVYGSTDMLLYTADRPRTTA